MKKILTIQDISCVGQCSLTVALPIISSFGIETAVIPTAVLSTHTAFSSFTFCDLTMEIPKIEQKFIEQNIKFDGFYTGYVGSLEQIKYISSIMDTCSNDHSLKVVDPCMADHGVLYKGFSSDFPKEMLTLCKKADIIVPNLTELCLLLGVEYKKYEKNELENIVKCLALICDASVVLTGVDFEEGKLGCLTYNKNKDSVSYYYTDKVPYFFHGTGDCYASALFGAMIKGFSLDKASGIACEFVYRALANTIDDHQEHWYGVHFEDALKYLTNL